MFVDESGHDHGKAPCEVLAGVAIEERKLWPLVQSIRLAEVEFFGVYMAEVGLEFKGRKLLKTKSFRLAGQEPPIVPSRRLSLAREFLLKGWRESQGNPLEARARSEFTAYGQAVLGFVRRVFALASHFGVRVFAAIVSKTAIRPDRSRLLRKDYVALFERYFYYLEDRSKDEMGLVVFDELEKAQSRILLGQLTAYFSESTKGYQRSARILPEPFFVHSDLTSLIQLADIVGYCLNWGWRSPGMNQPVRDEMVPFGLLAGDLQYRGSRYDPLLKGEGPISGIFYVDDLQIAGSVKKEKAMPSVSAATKPPP